jgi:hypothetical protein
MSYRVSVWVVSLFASLPLAAPAADQREMFEPSSFGDRIPDQPHAPVAAPGKAARTTFFMARHEPRQLVAYVHTPECQSRSTQPDGKGKARLVLVGGLSVAERPR